MAWDEKSLHQKGYCHEEECCSDMVSSTRASCYLFRLQDLGVNCTFIALNAQILCRRHWSHLHLNSETGTSALNETRRHELTLASALFLTLWRIHQANKNKPNSPSPLPCPLWIPLFPNPKPIQGGKKPILVIFQPNTRTAQPTKTSSSCSFRWPNSNPNLQQGTMVTNLYIRWWLGLTRACLRTLEALQNPPETWVSTSFDFLSLNLTQSTAWKPVTIHTYAETVSMRELKRGYYSQSR